MTSLVCRIHHFWTTWRDRKPGGAFVGAARASVPFRYRYSGWRPGASCSFCSCIAPFIGTFIMADVRTGLVLLDTDAYIQDAFVGLVIALAVIVNVKLTYRGR